MMKSRTITVSIAHPPASVAAFISNPENLPQWLTFITGIRKSGNDWFMQTDHGDIRIAFVSPNPFGILDHQVTLPDGAEILNPMRVIPNGPGSEVIFTLFQLPAMSDHAFETDAATVHKDLHTLKSVLEHQPPENAPSPITAPHAPH